MMLTNALRQAIEATVTENGHYAIKTTGSYLLDLYGTIGGLRGRYVYDLTEMFKRAFQEDPLLATRLVFYGRDIRGGIGERDVSRTLLHYLGIHHPDVAKQIIGHIPFYGRWDDLYSLFDTPVEEDALRMISDQLNADLDQLNVPMSEKRNISLLAKWLKSINCRNLQYREYAKRTARFLGMSPKEYRKALAKLRKELKIVEVSMSQKTYEDIDYEAVPSMAMLRYKSAFLRNDWERFDEYLDSLGRGESKINAGAMTPYDIVHALWSSWYSRREDDVLEAQWRALPDYLNGSKENIIVMADVSGSMSGRPMEVSTSLAMYFAEKNHGAFHGLFMTFETVPAFIEDDCTQSLRKRLDNVYRAPWGGNTDITAAYEKLLEMAIEGNVPPEDMPSNIIIISDMEDMEFDSATEKYIKEEHRYVKAGKTLTDEMRDKFEAAGYKVPGIIYWNVEARKNHFQVRENDINCQLASGASPAVFKSVLAALGCTPSEALFKTLTSDRYSRITFREDTDFEDKNPLSDILEEDDEYEEDEDE